MINRSATIRWKEYDPDDLSSGSNKRVWANCEDCGTGRWISYNQYRALCNSCSHKNIFPSEETRKKISESKMGIKNPMFGKHHSEETKKRIRDTTSGENSPNYGKHRTDATKKKISESLIGKYKGKDNPNYGKHPSIETLEKMRRPRPSIIGENNPNYGKGLFGESNGNWKGGASSEDEIFRGSPEYKKWRISVFERDDYTCKECDQRGGDMNAHHILPVRDWKDPQYSLNIANGITLCERCHSEVKDNEYEFFSKYFDIANGVGV